MESAFSNAERAEVLTQALPYIKKYNGKIVVVKYGGNAMINDQLKEQVMEDIVLLWLIGVKVVLVHGGGPEISETMEKLGKKSEFIDGLRVTDKETVDIVQMVLAGKINKSLVNFIEAKGGRAIGLSGMDGRLIEAETKNDKLGYVGSVTKINPAPITDLLEKGYIPVISTLGCDRKGNTYNINGDTAAACIAGALFGEKTDNDDRYSRSITGKRRPFHAHSRNIGERGGKTPGRGNDLGRNDPENRMLYRSDKQRR